jgi:hypothetical protein
MRRVVTILSAIALVLGALSTTARAVTLVSPSGDARIATFQAWANAADVPTPTGVVDLVFASCPVAVSDGCTSYGPTPTIFLGPEVRDRPILLHELGHAFDAQRMTPGRRAAFERIFGDTRPWRSPPNSPNERFAEAYSLCARHAHIARTYEAAYGYRATPSQHLRVCALIRRAAT